MTRHADLPDAGRTPHHVIDNLLPSQEQKDALEGLSVAHFAAGVRTIHKASNIPTPPTDAALDALFGQPADLGSGFIALLLDTATSTAYLIASDGSSWYYTALSAA